MSVVKAIARMALGQDQSRRSVRSLYAVCCMLHTSEAGSRQNTVDRFP